MTTLSGGRPVPLTLTIYTAVPTTVGNGYGSDKVFSRQIDAVGAEVAEPRKILWACGADHGLAAGEARSLRETTGRLLGRVDPQFHRPAAVDLLLDDAAKARAEPGWQPEVTFDQLVEMMVKADMDGAAAAA